TKFESIYEKASFVEDGLKKIKEEYNVTHIFIEDTLVRATGGRSTAHTVAILIKFNSIVSWIAHKVFELEPTHIPVLTARKKLKIVIPKSMKGAKNTKLRKEFILSSVL